MAGWTETARYSFQHLHCDVPNRRPRFGALRVMACATGKHRWKAILLFSSFGHRLQNPEVLDCPEPGCGREGAVIG